MKQWRIAPHEAPDSNEDGHVVKLSTLAWVGGEFRDVPLVTDDLETLAAQWVEKKHGDLDYPEEVDVWIWEDGRLETVRKLVVECRRTVTFHASMQEGGAE